MKQQIVDGEGGTGARQESKSWFPWEWNSPGATTGDCPYTNFRPSLRRL